MSEDATLSDFFDAESDADSESDPAEPPIDVDSEAETNVEPEAGDSPRAESARSTYGWGGDRVCGECSATVDRVWRDGGGLVCETCKEW